MGMEDYVLHMYPEDDMETHGDYLMYRSYPDFTAKRLAVARTNVASTSRSGSGGYDGRLHNLAPSHDFTCVIDADYYADAQGRASSLADALTNWQFLLSQEAEKGRSETVGLWMFATDAREPMKDVMMR